MSQFVLDLDQTPVFVSLVSKPGVLNSKVKIFEPSNTNLRINDAFHNELFRVRLNREHQLLEAALYHIVHPG